MTQSTASQHIQGLEEELGIKLFDRGRGAPF
ncbi:LysR family transcriptional regulator [Geobacter sp. FeAm09]|nr:LysR family transcriptional regulator [Geobacter sp. FeAm09]